MLCFLTLKKVATACTTKKSKVLEKNPTEEQLKNLATWTETDFICKNLILNGLTDELYDYYSTMTTAKEVWDALPKESHEFQKIAHEIISEGMPLDDQFQVPVIIDKLPLLWKDFKSTLRHKTKEFSLESLITRLRIEEEARKHDKKEEVNAIPRKKPTAVLKPDLKPKGNKMKLGSNKQNNPQSSWWLDTGASPPCLP
ncbi:uncharacterized protein E5676_scaffold522G00020 [Cucumis melo var. makuwa]|uniref:Uncharacterized protein n=1 Tax=Cucumis melo var. makuwa TaxID=1194695 RepID=A0A5A7UEL0_CUCMM|nr:uncharacterized protein E6C27_scaffold190G00370 [Cucumis melo var. makuwa]TYK19091.1 uncharacterized protein E5676_scaffold522G00020 [Cucumis melo var. makuwa]